MKFAGILRFELAYQLRRPWPWLMFAVMLVVSFLMTRDAAVADMLYEDYFVNAPFYIAISTVVGGVLWLLLGPVIAGEAAARDVATGMYPLVYASPLGRAEFLGARFTAAFLLNAGLLLALQLGILLAVYSPGVNPALIAPFRPASYLTAYAFLSLPNAFFGSALQFRFALRSGRPAGAYVGSMILVFMSLFVASLIFYSRGAGTLLDPIGMRFVIEDIAHMWTTVEKTHRLLSFDGIIRTNRLIWLGVGAAVLALTIARFRFAHRVESGWRAWRRRRRVAHAPAPSRLGISAHAPIPVPHVPRANGFGIRVQQTLAIARASFHAIARSRAGLGFFVVIPLLTIVILLDQMFAFGAGLTPTTGQVLKEMTAPLSSELSRWVIVPLLTAFFAGELVWREREAGVDEIADAVPLSDWVPLLGKLIGLAFVLAAFLACLMAAGMVAQTLLGHRDFDFGVYLAVLFGFQLPEYLLFAVLAVAVHVLVGQKYVGHMVAIVLYVVILLAPMFGIEHDMLIYGAGPWWSYTEMRGLGPFVAPWLAFRLYWAAWALLFVVGARLLWLRGRESGLGTRLLLARRRLTGATARAAALAVLLVLGLGGFVFYNTNVLNEYVTPQEMAHERAEYERRYARYAQAPQPYLAEADLDIDVRPDAREVDIRGSYRLVNHTDGPIDTLHVATLPVFETRTLAFDRPASLVLADERRGHRIYALGTPLLPGESMRLDFDVHVERPGFGEGGRDMSIVPNGTLFTQHWLPLIGYQPMRELLVPAERREQGLPARPVIPSLYDAAARSARHPGVVLHTVISTEGDQVAVAPGALRRAWSADGRSHFEYETDGPIGSEWIFTSARYAVEHARWNDVDIRVYHHPDHATHPARMIRGIQQSLDLYTSLIAPYPYRHVTVVEVPGDGVGMHAEASMLSHGEGVTLLRVEDDGAVDMPFAVMAHEMAHQWAMSIAVVEGAPVLAEGVAWYYALQAVEHTRGTDQLRRLTSQLRKPYPIAPIHRGEPLLRGLDPWMSYRKTPYVLMALREYLGADVVNDVLRALYLRHRAPDAPLATTLDLYAALRAAAPDSMQGLLHDLFEVNAFWQFRTERVRAEPIGDDTWRVTLDVHARKTVVDLDGVETELPIDEPVQIAVFRRAQSGRQELSAPLHVGMHRVRPGLQTITIDVRGEPAAAGIDPFHLLDWEENEDDDNIETVTTEMAQ